MDILKGKTAIVTDSSKGTGRGIVLVLVESGADLVINGNNQGQPEHVKVRIETLDSRCRVARGDTSDNNTAVGLVAVCMEAFGKIDILVSSASINSRVPFLELTEEGWRRVMRVNLDGVFYCYKAILPHMVYQQPGTVINISPMANKTAHTNASICYGTSKAVVNSMTQKLTCEMGPHHIWVNGTCPGLVKMDMSL